MSAAPKTPEKVQHGPRNPVIFTNTQKCGTCNVNPVSNGYTTCSSCTQKMNVPNKCAQCNTNPVFGTFKICKTCFENSRNSPNPDDRTKCQSCNKNTCKRGFQDCYDCFQSKRRNPQTPKITVDQNFNAVTTRVPSIQANDESTNPLEWSGNKVYEKNCVCAAPKTIKRQCARTSTNFLSLTKYGRSSLVV